MKTHHIINKKAGGMLNTEIKVYSYTEIDTAMQSYFNNYEQYNSIQSIKC